MVFNSVNNKINSYKCHLLQPLRKQYKYSTPLISWTPHSFIIHYILFIFVTKRSIKKISVRAPYVCPSHRRVSLNKIFKDSRTTQPSFSPYRVPVVGTDVNMQNGFVRLDCTCHSVLISDPKVFLHKK